MWPAIISVAAAVLAFLGVALFLARRGLHRSLETMPVLANEATLVEVRDLALVFHRGGGGPSRITYPGCIARVTTSRLLIAQQLGGHGQNRMLSVVLSPAGETAMRVADAEAIDRALKSFTLGRVVPGSLAPTHDGGVSVSMEYIGPSVAPPNPPRWDFPPSAAAQLGAALREAGVC